MAGKRAVTKAGLVWREPGPAAPKGGGTNHEAAAEELRANPQIWAEVARYSTSTSAYTAANGVRSGRTRAYLPGGAYEATIRHEDNAYTLFVRYVGTTDE